MLSYLMKRWIAPPANYSIRPYLTLSFIMEKEYVLGTD